MGIEALCSVLSRNKNLIFYFRQFFCLNVDTLSFSYNNKWHDERASGGGGGGG